MNYLELLYDHYKETNEIVKKNEKERNNFFTNILISLLILMFLISGDGLLSMFKEYIKSTYSFDFTFSNNIIKSGIWLYVFLVIIKYFNINIQIDRKYKYIHELEQKLCNNKLDITREGKTYMNNYPLISNIIYYSYRIVFPIISIIFILTNIIFTIVLEPQCALFYFQIIVSLICLIIYIIYLIYNIKEII